MAKLKVVKGRDVPEPELLKRELTLVNASEFADEEYEGHLVGENISSGSSDLLTWIVVANGMMIWPWVIPWYCWIQLFRRER